MKIYVLGTGCASCKKLEENVRKAVSESGIKAEVEYVDEIQRIAEYGITSVPALVVNEEIVSVGRVLTVSQIKDILSEQ